MRRRDALRAVRGWVVAGLGLPKVTGGATVGAGPRRPKLVYQAGVLREDGGTVLRVLHHEILANVTEAGPLPNRFVYRRPWYRDEAMVAMVLKATGNLGLPDPYAVPPVFDPYSALFWWDFREAHVAGPRFDAEAAPHTWHAAEMFLLLAETPPPAAA